MAPFTERPESDLRGKSPLISRPFKYLPILTNGRINCYYRHGLRLFRKRIERKIGQKYEIRIRIINRDCPEEKENFWRKIPLEIWIDRGKRGGKRARKWWTVGWARDDKVVACGEAYRREAPPIYQSLSTWRIITGCRAKIGRRVRSYDADRVEQRRRRLEERLRVEFR